MKNLVLNLMVELRVGLHPKAVFGRIPSRPLLDTRCFYPVTGLFLKQILYFDRYTRILAPSLQVSQVVCMNPCTLRVSFRRWGQASGATASPGRIRKPCKNDAAHPPFSLLPDAQVFNDERIDIKNLSRQYGV